MTAYPTDPSPGTGLRTLRGGYRREDRSARDCCGAVVSGARTSAAGREVSTTEIIGFCMRGNSARRGRGVRRGRPKSRTRREFIREAVATLMLKIDEARLPLDVASMGRGGKQEPGAFVLEQTQIRACDRLGRRLKGSLDHGCWQLLGERTGRYRTSAVRHHQSWYARLPFVSPIRHPSAARSGVRVS